MQLPIVDNPTGPSRRRLPPWLRVPLPAGAAHLKFNATSSTIDDNALHTVCEEARCPNIHDCWARGTATFMIAGDTCTRGCRFCSVRTEKAPPPPDDQEPHHLAAAVRRMQLEHVVITVVNRDDQPDGGAAHYRACVAAVHDACPAVSIELLCSDLSGDVAALAVLLEDSPLDVFAHNVECVARLDSLVRDPRASFQQSLDILAGAKRIEPAIVTKSSLMAGLGETHEEMLEAMVELRRVGVELLTIGQYLAPGKPGERFLPVARYVPPEEFTAWEQQAYRLGFAGVAAGPLVRSSYRAEELLSAARQRQTD